MPTRFVLTTLLIALLATLAPTASAAPTDDFDHDNIPDDVESELCGRPVVRDNLHAPIPYECVSSTDLRYDSTVYTGIYEGVQLLTASTWSIVDLDGDFVPDEIEPLLCQVENQNSPTDGSCIGDDYRLLPSCADVPEPIVCQETTYSGIVTSFLGVKAVNFGLFRI